MVFRLQTRWKKKIIISFDWSHSFVSSTVDITTLSAITSANSNIAWFYHTNCKAIKNHRIDYGFFRFPDYKMSNWRVWLVIRGFSLLYGTWSYFYFCWGLCLLCFCSVFCLWTFHFKHCSLSSDFFKYVICWFYVF